ncbi:MAG: M28 family peptidase [Ignavibacteria bacterium]
MDKELSGDTITVIGGLPYRIFSRWRNSPSNEKAAQYILEKFQAYGFQARYQYNNSHNVNVIARKTGSVHPNHKIVISAHYDNILSGSVLPTDTIYGADDNASGVVAVLEAARLLANYNSPYTIEFVAFDEEENGLLGAYGYADSTLVSNDTIISVLNMDMIGWDSNNDGLVRIITPSGFEILSDILINCYSRYNIALNAIKSYNAGGSDHLAFWNRGIVAITSIEPASDFHQYYHTKGDIFSRINMNYFINNTKANIAALMSIADERIYSIYHNPLPSGLDTSTIFANAYITFPIPYGTGSNAPRLYYKINNGSYQYVNPYNVNNSDYTFRIPGQPQGTKVSYYIAAQDSTGIYLATSPGGGSGVNPPGTTPPQSVYTYYVWSATTYTSNQNKQILDNEYTYDTIYIPQQGIIEDVELNLNLIHANDGDILITLIKDATINNLSQFNGDGGQNYTNTMFDDSATVLITQGTPPFTGQFKPQNPMTGFRSKQMQGNWILRIYDIRAGNTGNLLNWTLNLKYSTQVSVKKVENIIPEKFELYQNYPNPFNPTTKIKFQIKDAGLVKLTIYDLLGKEVEILVNENLKAGVYEYGFNSKNLSSGIYFYRLSTGDFVDTKRMVLLK